MITHAQNEFILVHARNAHKLNIKTQQILEDVKVLYKSSENFELILGEAIIFKEN